MVYVLASAILFIAACAVSIIGSFHNPGSAVSAQYELIQNQAERSGADSFVAPVSFEDNSKLPETLYAATYSSNFSGKSTRLISVSDSEGRPSKFGVSFAGQSLSDTYSIVSGNTYSNQKDTIRFETVMINLLEFREKSEELWFDQTLFDGFVYLPDYAADEIIEGNELLNNYADLIDLAQTEPVIIGNGNKQLRYRIANVFHVNGFNESYRSSDTLYSYNDRDTGLGLGKYLGSYCFASNYRRLKSSEDSVSLVYFTDPKIYALKENLQTVAINAGEEQVETHLFFTSGDQIERCDLGGANLLGSTNVSSVDVFTIGLVLLLIIYGVFQLFMCFGLRLIGRFRRIVFLTCLSLSAALALFLAIGFIVKLINPFSVAAIMFFNEYSQWGPVLLLVMNLLVVLCSSIVRVRKI